MLKTTGSIGSVADLKETKGKAGGNSVVGDSVVDDGEATK